MQIFGTYIRTIARELLASFRQRGVFRTLKAMMRTCWYMVSFPYYWLLQRNQKVSFEGAEISYMQHPYNITWCNERAVEIPMAAILFKKTPPTDVLEVGNVLQHYGYRAHTVIDRFETFQNVQNVDVRNYQPGRKFALVLSVSTLEHIGVDDGGKPQDAADALEHCLSLVAPGGRFFGTFLVGDNSALDAWIRTPRENVEISFYKRSWGNIWQPYKGAPQVEMLCSILVQSS